MRLSHILRGSASFAVLTVAAAGAGSAVAADSPAAPEVTNVREIVVTAQKREQSLQDVPIVVTSLPAKLLQDAGVRDIKDMTILSPGLTVTSTSSEASTTARIRGIGTVGDNPGLESSVGIVIDGVYRPRNGVGFGDLGETDRIEILKGPQGTLFGKNTSAGVINIVTKGPQFTFGAQGEATFGNYGEKGGSVAVTGPITDKIAGRLFFADRERDGFYDVVTAGGPRTDTKDNDRKYWTARAQLLIQPSDTASFRIIGDYTKRDEHCCAAVQIRSGPTAYFLNGLAAGGQGVTPPVTGGSFGPPPGYQMLPFSRTAYSNRDTGQQVIDKGISIEGNVDFGSTTLTSISAVRGWSSTNGQDADFSGADVWYRPEDGTNSTHFATFSEELRLAGKTEHTDWMIGAFFADEHLTSNQALLYGNDYNKYWSLNLSQGANNFFVQCLSGSFTGPAPNCDGPAHNGTPAFSPGSGDRDHYAQNDFTSALFTNETWHLTQKFDITFGARLTSDKKKLWSSYRNVGTNGAACQATVGNLLTGKLAFVGANAGKLTTFMCLPWENYNFNSRDTYQQKNGTDTSGTLKAAYRWSPDVMTYLSYTTGYKAGGFNFDRIQSTDGTPAGLAPGLPIAPVTDTSYPAETVKSLEAGAKTTWLDGKLLLNATYFNQRFQHFQLNQFLGTSFVVESIPAVSSQGVDADFLYFTPIKGLTWQGGVTYAQTMYKKFGPSDLISPSHYPNLSLLPGSRTSFAPLVSASTAVTYDHSLTDSLRLLVSLDAKYTSKYNTGSDLLPAKIQNAMTLVNGRIGIGSADRRWTVELWGQNLTNVKYKQVAFNGPLQGSNFGSTVNPAGPYKGTYYDPSQDTTTYDAFLGAPRTVGITLRARY